MSMCACFSVYMRVCFFGKFIRVYLWVSAVSLRAYQSYMTGRLSTSILKPRIGSRTPMWICFVFWCKSDFGATCASKGGGVITLFTALTNTTAWCW